MGSAQATITRDDVVNNATPFTTTQVTLAAANLLSPTTSLASPSTQCDFRYPGIVCAGAFTGESYVWGGFDTTSNWQSNISPGNKKAVAGSQLGGNLTGYIQDRQGTKYYFSDFTGVDCSGLVSRAWGLSSKQNTAGLRALTLPIPWSQMKKGDIFVRDQDMGDNTHVALVSQDISGQAVSIIHAASKGFARGSAQWRTMAESGVPLSCPDDYNCYLGTSRLMATGTPFPQFSNFSPSDGGIIGSSRPTVSADIRSATNINTASIVLKVDGNTIAGPSISGSGTQVSVSSTLVNALSDGSHTVTVLAENSLTLQGQASIAL